MNHTCDKIAWQGVVPEHWQVLKLRQILSPVSEKNHPDLPLLSVVREKGVIVRNIEDKEENHNYVPDDLSGYKLVKIGQFAMNKMKAWQGSYGVSRFDGIVSPAYFVFDIQCDINKDFFNRAIRSVVYVNYFGQASDGIRVGQWDLSIQRMKEIPFLLPPRPEQNQIVRFLDWKVSAINRLISIKRKQIALLHERQCVHISHIVTHGLHGHVATKNSGVEWIGDIPKHWQAMRCKYLFSERDERSQEGTEQHLSMSQKYGLVPDSQLDERRMLSESYAGGKLCYKDDLVLNRLKAHLGVFALSPQSGVISSDYTVLIPNTERVLPTFAETVLKSDRCRGELRIRVRGIIEGFWRLYTDDFNTIVLPVPPIEEQAEIMEYIIEFRGKTKKYEDSLTQEISTLQEFKARLISDVVTGKIDIRDIEIPECEFVEETVDTVNDESMDGMGGETYEE